MSMNWGFDGDLGEGAQDALAGVEAEIDDAFLFTGEYPEHVSRTFICRACEDMVGFLSCEGYCRSCQAISESIKATKR